MTTRIAQTFVTSSARSIDGAHRGLWLLTLAIVASACGEGGLIARADGAADVAPFFAPVARCVVTPGAPAPGQSYTMTGTMNGAQAGVCPAGVCDNSTSTNRSISLSPGWLVSSVTRV